MSEALETKTATGSDVARLAGVSIATVSYVVNDGPRKVAPETARRVRRAIELVGYSPNFSARSLKRGQTLMLGLVLPDITNPYFAELALAIQEEAGKRGQAVLTVDHGGSAERQGELVRGLVQRGVDHVLIASPASPVDNPSVGGPPQVLVDCASPIQGAATVGPDSEAGAAEAVRHLIEVHHHTRIAIALGETGAFGAENRERGWRRALSGSGLADGPIERAPFTREGGYSAGVKLASSSERPTAIFASSDLQAFGLLCALWERGLSVPDDVAVVTFDDTIGARYSWPPLTAVRQPVRAIARAAVSTVLDPNGSGSGHQSFPMELVIRRSCGCPSQGIDASTTAVS